MGELSEVAKLRRAVLSASSFQVKKKKNIVACLLVFVEYRAFCIQVICHILEVATRHILLSRFHKDIVSCFWHRTTLNTSQR